MDKDARVMLVSVITNIVLIITKLVAGILGKSGAVIADGVHSLSDLITDFFSIIGVKLSKKPSDQKHPYGHGKLEYLTSIGIGLMVLAVGFMIIYNSAGREVVVPSSFVIIATLFTIVAKFFLSSYVIYKGKQYKNNILLASGKESNADVISSIVVLISSILMQFEHDILKYADIVASIIVGIFIVRIGFNILKENISIILDEQETDNEYIEKIKNMIIKEEKIKSVDNLILIKFGSYYKLTMEISIDSNVSLLDAHNISHKIEAMIKKEDHAIRYINTHINPSLANINYSLRDITMDDREFILDAQREIVVADNHINEKELKELQDYFEKEFNDYFEYYKIIELDSKKIGMLCYYLEDDHYNLSSIYLKYKYRDLGIGHKIITDLINDSNRRNIKLWVYKTNTKALKFYCDLNFKIKKETEERYLMIYKH
ncbi:MAG: GNAT family N-acetyltransferase [Bacilli bacterium]|nr:GNAT family N-acetyltransferase [Bacilli bacterium]MDD4808944.1 GNAT family N-acetyltransferase [Bacilli bacterium]